MTLSSPREPERRGGSVVFDFDGSGAIARQLNGARYFCDHRPDVGLRISPHFYTRDDEIDAFFAKLHELR